MAAITEKSENPLVVKSVTDLVAKIKVGKLKGSINISLATLTVLEEIISQADNANAYELVSRLRTAGGMLHRGLPHEPSAANVARRVLRAVRVETRANTDQQGEAVSAAGESLQQLVLARPARRGTLACARDLREPIREHMQELRLELESTVSAIAVQAAQHVAGGAVLLAARASALGEAFLRAARPARLLLPEGPHARQTHAMAARLSELGMPVTVITNAAVFAVMSRVTKVVLEASSVLTGGAVLAPAGAHNITVAALYYNVPVLVLSPLGRLSPLQAADPADVALAPPHRLHRYEDHGSEEAHVLAPAHDFITPDHITLFITNTGGSSPSYIYRTMSELYDPADNELPLYE